MQPLAASGLRSLRYAIEVDGLGAVLASDIDKGEFHVDCVQLSCYINLVRHFVGGQDVKPHRTFSQQPETFMKDLSSSLTTPSSLFFFVVNRVWIAFDVKPVHVEDLDT